MSITKYTTANGEKYRVRIRRRGFKTVDETFASREEARAFEREMNRARRDGNLRKANEADRHTLHELIERYVAYTLPKKSLSPVMCENTKAYLRFWDEEIGNHYLSQVTAPLVREVRDRLSDRKSAATCNRHLSALTTCLEVARADYKWLDDKEPHPLRGKGLKLTEPKGRVRFLSADERARLLAACAKSSNPDLEDIVRLALATGARQGEILALRIRDLDLNRGRATLPKTKNGEARAIYIAAVLDRLQARIKVRDLRDDRLFPHQTKDRIIWAFGVAVKSAGIEDLHFHDLRHEFASQMAMSGASLLDIARALGHKSLEMTNRYAHLCDSHLGDVVARMNHKVNAID